MKSAAFDYERPKDVSGALKLLTGESKLLAGGQSLGPMLNLRIVHPSLLIDVRGIDELKQVKEEQGSVTLGACITHSQIEDGRVPDSSRGLMRHVASRIAYRAVRNRGTIGGSLSHADPAADWPTALALLNGVAIVQGQKGIGEGGAIAPPAAIANAINDALAPLGVEITESPMTPRRIVEALMKKK